MCNWLKSLFGMKSSCEEKDCCCGHKPDDKTCCEEKKADEVVAPKVEETEVK